MTVRIYVMEYARFGERSNKDISTLIGGGKYYTLDIVHTKIKEPGHEIETETRKTYRGLT